MINRLSARPLICYCPQMYDRCASRYSALQLAEVEKILIVDTVKANDVIPEVEQMACYRGADFAAVASDQDAHVTMLSRI